jgi:hypothetical protein
MESDLAAVFKHTEGEPKHSVDRLLVSRRHPSISAHNFGVKDVAIFLVNDANADAANHAPDENMTLECFQNGIRCGSAILHELGQ